MTQLIQLIANTINGVEKVTEKNGVPDNADHLTQQDFYKSLKTLEDGEIIAALVDSTMLEKIEKEYGIH